MADRPTARRCATCDTNWPNMSIYEQCPRGHGPTWQAADETPISHPDADRIMKAHKKFAEYMAKRAEEISMLEAALAA